jgi:hypothetical protein
MEECCPKFDPKPWDGKVLDWDGKLFLKGSVLCLFYMPLNFGGVISRLFAATKRAGAKMEDGPCMSDHTSMFNMDIYVPCGKEVPGETSVRLSGRHLCKIYEGDFKDTGKFCKDFYEYAKGRKMEIGKLYMWYTTCPKCAKKWGKNYVGVIGGIKK